MTLKFSRFLEAVEVHVHAKINFIKLSAAVYDRLSTVP